MTTPTPDQTCGCGAVLTSERQWSKHIADGCQLAGRPRTNPDALARAARHHHKEEA